MSNSVNNFVGDALSNLKALVDVNTIIGEQIVTPDGTAIIPVSKVTFGYGMGAGDVAKESSSGTFGGGTSGGVTISPIAFLVVKDGGVQLLQLASANNTAERVVNMVPDVVDKISGIITKKDDEKKKKSAADNVVEL